MPNYIYKTLHTQCFIVLQCIANVFAHLTFWIGNLWDKSTVIVVCVWGGGRKHFLRSLLEVNQTPPSSWSPGATPRDVPLLLRSAGRHWLRGSAGGGLPAAHPAPGPGSGCVLPTGPTPPARHVFYPLQPGRLQKPARHTSARERLRRLLWQTRGLGEGWEG